MPAGHEVLRYLLQCLLFLGDMASADELVSRVVKTTDGDTVVVLAGHQQIKVRIAGMDAPEK